MMPRAVWRPPWYAWSALGLAALLLIHRGSPWLLRGRSIFVVLVALGAVLLVIAALWELPPAAMMCGALALTIFSGSWENLGLPGFPFLPDRILLVGALLAVLLRAPGASTVPRLRLRGVHLLLGLDGALCDGLGRGRRHARDEGRRVRSTRPARGDTVPHAAARPSDLPGAARAQHAVGDARRTRRLPRCDGDLRGGRAGRPGVPPLQSPRTTRWRRSGRRRDRFDHR